VAVAIPSDPALAHQLQDDIERALLAQRFEERDIFSIKLLSKRPWSTPSSTATRPIATNTSTSPIG